MEWLKRQFELAFNTSLNEVVSNGLFPDNVKIFGISVNPGIISAFLCTFILLMLALVIRLFVVPKFKMIPTKTQLFFEELVGFFNTSSTPSHRHSYLVGGYTFVVGSFIAVTILLELIGLRPALASINACLAIGTFTFLVIHFSGVREHGILRRIKRILNPVNIVTDISAPLSISLRLYGSTVSGYIITAILYSTVYTSIAIPAVASILTTLLHVLLQPYLFTILTNMYVGDAVKIKA